MIFDVFVKVHEVTPGRRGLEVGFSTQVRIDDRKNGKNDFDSSICISFFCVIF